MNMNRIKTALASIVLLYVVGCFAPSYDVKSLDYNDVVLDYDRSGFGSAPFPFWMHLTPFETAALLDAGKAKAGDPDALLALAFLASGDVRDSAVFMKYKTRVSKFITRIRPDINAQKDAWQKGFQLYQSMRKEFYTKDSVQELAGYDWFKSGISGIFENGSYNCISSSMLYCILARSFDMKVKGVILPTHAFVQLHRDTGKNIEIETTSKLGFDWIHDENYYKTKSVGWFQARGLFSTTYADYCKRSIMEPYQLICYNMTNQHTDLRHMRVEAIHRLMEIQGFVETSNPLYQRSRLILYSADFGYLQKIGDYKTAEKLFRCVDPIIESTQRTLGKDTAIINLIGRLRCNRDGVLVKLKKFDEFIAGAQSTLAMLPLVTADRENLLNNCLSNVYNFLSLYVASKEFDKMEQLADIIIPYAGKMSWANQNLQWAYGMEMNYQWEKKNWPEVIRICKKQLRIAADAENKKIARGNIESAYCNWSNSFQEAGNWPKARDILQQCEKDSVQGQGQCSKYLKQLEGAHRF
jgi:hypothetical protein